MDTENANLRASRAMQKAASYDTLEGLERWKALWAKEWDSQESVIIHFDVESSTWKSGVGSL